MRPFVENTSIHPQHELDIEPGMDCFPELDYDDHKMFIGHPAHECLYRLYDAFDYAESGCWWFGDRQCAVAEAHLAVRYHVREAWLTWLGADAALLLARDLPLEFWPLLDQYLSGVKR